LLVAVVVVVCFLETKKTFINSPKDKTIQKQYYYQLKIDMKIKIKILPSNTLLN